MQRVYLVPHDGKWAEVFLLESKKLSEILFPVPHTIHHIGSTAIPGLPAKPIIDLMLEIDDPEFRQLDALSSDLEILGYEVMGEFGIFGRRYFRKNDGAGNRTHQVHAFQTGSPQLRRHLAFRDFLRSHPVEASEYAELKQWLANLHPWDVSAYTDGKDKFIQRIDELALI